MASSPLTLLVLFAVARGVLGADKELGQTCDPAADKCVHPTLLLTCDAFAKKCFIQQDQACSGDGHEYLCVTGAECDGTSNKCECKGSVYTVSGAGCSVAEDKYAGACPSGGMCTAASNLLCASSFCGCTDATFEPDLSAGTCAAIPVEKKGRPCTSANEATECGASATTHLECDTTTSNACQCVANYYGVNGGVCSEIPTAKVGRPCTSANEATECGATATTHLECDTTTSNACQCVANYYGVTGGDCYPAAGKLKGGCSGTGKGTCTDSDALCTGTGAKLCERDLGGACTATSDCADSAAVCDGFSKKCVLPTGQACNTDAKKDKCVTGASCDTEGSSATNNCKCITGVYTDTSNMCYAAQGKATGTCKATAPKCDDANAECDTNSTPNRCTCKTGYKVKNADATCESGAIAVMTSAITVMLAAVSSRLFTLH